MSLHRYGLAAVVLLSGAVLLSTPRLEPYLPNSFPEESLSFAASSKNETYYVGAPSLVREIAVSPIQSEGSHKSSRISYSILPGMRYQLPFSNTSRDYACRLGRFKYRYQRAFHKRVLEPKSVLGKMNYTTFVNTSLKILILGDSVAFQLAELLEEATKAVHETRMVSPSTVVTASAPIRGGGVLGAFRLNGMFLKKNEDTQQPDSVEGAWRRTHVHELLNHTYVGTLQNGQPQNKIVGSFDAMVFRIPHGWVHYNEITRESLLEGIELAHELFGVSTVVLLTLHFNNNIETMDDLLAFAEVNHMILDFAAKWRPNGGVEHVFVLDFASLTDQVLTENAKLLNRNTSNPGFSLERLCGKKFNPSVAHICASQRRKRNPCDCVMNPFTYDGMHICAETLGGRVVAGIACQLRCLDRDEKDIAACASHCSDMFMSLKPLDASEISLHSRPRQD